MELKMAKDADAPSVGIYLFSFLLHAVCFTLAVFLDCVEKLFTGLLPLLCVCSARAQRQII